MEQSFGAPNRGKTTFRDIILKYENGECPNFATFLLPHLILGVKKKAVSGKWAKMKRFKYFLISTVVAMAAFGASGWLEHPVFAENPKRVLKLYAKEFVIQPSDTYALAGAVRILLFNEGTVPHALAIEGRKGTLLRVPPGDAAEVTVNLEEGEYVFYCPQEGHREKGMVGLLKMRRNGW